MNANEIIDIKYLYDLDYENNLCVDCKGPMPKFVSINNAILLCQSCAKRHESLGFNISFVKEIQSDWDLYLLTYIQRGGNGRFIRIQKEYGIEEMPIESKYTTKAAEYHRLLIKSEVMAEPPPSAPLKSVGKEKSPLTEVYFPEFGNYQIIELKDNPNTTTDGYLSKFYSNTIQKLGKGFEISKDFFSKQITQTEIKDNVKNGTYQMFQALKNAGNYLYQQSKPIVRFVSQKTEDGVGYIYGQLKENNNKSKEEENITGMSNKSDNESVEESKSSKLEPITELVNESKSNVGFYTDYDSIPVTNSVQLSNINDKDETLMSNFH